MLFTNFINKILHFTAYNRQTFFLTICEFYEILKKGILQESMLHKQLQHSVSKDMVLGNTINSLTPSTKLITKSCFIKQK